MLALDKTNRLGSTLLLNPLPPPLHMPLMLGCSFAVRRARIMTAFSFGSMTGKFRGWSWCSPATGLVRGSLARCGSGRLNPLPEGM